MNKTNIASFFKNMQTAVSKHSPEILTGIGLAGMVTTTVLAVRATPKALKLIEEKKHDEMVDRLPTKDVIKVTWKCYIPAVVSGVTSAACIIGASSVNAKRNAALATAYKLSEAALVEYKEKVIETIGEKKEQVIREQIDKDKVENNPVNKTEIIMTGKGNTLFFDSISKRYFKSDIEKIRRAENTLNKSMLHDMFGYVSLNDLYDEIGLERLSIGDELGWNVNKLMELDFTTQLTPDNEPCIVLTYSVEPKYNYTAIGY